MTKQHHVYHSVSVGSWDQGTSMMAERTSAAQSTISDSSSSSGNQDEDSTRVLESLSSQDSNGTCTEGHDEDTPLVLGADDDDSNKNDKVKDQVDNNNGHNNTGSTSGGSGFAGKPRRASILKSGKPKVKKSVSFCSMPEDRRVSNGKFTCFNNNVKCK